MQQLYALLVLFGFLGIKASLAYIPPTDCIQISEFDDEENSIDDIAPTNFWGRSSPYENCWKIVAPPDHFIRIRFKTLNFNQEDCQNTYLNIRITNTNEEFKFCRPDEILQPITALSDVEITFHVHRAHRASFTLYYEFRAYLLPTDCIQISAFDDDGNSIDDIAASNIWGRRPPYQSCWKIVVPPDHFIRLRFETLNFHQEDCQNTYLNIRITNTNEEFKFCRPEEILRPITALSDVEITFHVHSDHDANFKLDYEIQDVKCLRVNSFHCSKHSCIPMSHVCNDIIDCPNGADERNCETGINSIEGIEAAREKSIAWLKSKKSPLKGWRENTVRAVTALYLSEKSIFNGQILEEELMAKQIELETAVSLLRGKVSNQLLSMHINALLLTCQDPRRFYGKDLVKILKDQVNESGNFTHPSAYLALCNAKEEWPERAASDLLNILNSDSEYSFIGEFQAFAVMAIACYNKTDFLNRTENTDLLSVYQKSIKNFKEHQLSDGSFGNVFATSLITQSLLASGQEHTKDWKLNATMKYLMKELESTHADFLAYYLMIPVLNRKSLADIAKFNCSNISVDPLEQLGLEMKHHVGTKIKIQYSLFVGDEKDIVHTIRLKVPPTFTAFQVMQSAEREDPKYKFQWKKIFDKIDVYKIAQISNDPEIGKFWLLFHGSGDKNDLTQTFTSPDQLKLEDNSHLVLWYRNVDV